MPIEARLWQLYRHLRGLVKDPHGGRGLANDRNVKGAIKALEQLLNVRPETRVGE